MAASRKPRKAVSGKTSKKQDREAKRELDYVEKQFQKLMREKKPPITKKTIAIIDKNTRKSRKFAVGIAAVADCLQGHIEGYQEVAHLLGAVKVRIEFALANREDMQEVMAEGKSRTTSENYTDEVKQRVLAGEDIKAVLADIGRRQDARDAAAAQGVHHATQG